MRLLTHPYEFDLPLKVGSKAYRINTRTDKPLGTTVTGFSVIKSGETAHGLGPYRLRGGWSYVAHLSNGKTFLAFPSHVEIETN